MLTTLELPAAHTDDECIRLPGGHSKNVLAQISSTADKLPSMRTPAVATYGKLQERAAALKRKAAEIDEVRDGVEHAYPSLQRSL